MILLHRSIGVAIAAIFLFLTLWGLFAWIRNRHPGEFFWKALGAGQAGLGLQVVVGIVMVIARGGQHWLHYVYGGFPILVLVFAHRASRRAQGLEWSVFAIAGLFIFGLQLRGLMTAT